jgi:hypothetical protein
MIFISASPTGLANARLHIVIHGFAFWKDAKPADEHDLQALPTALKPGSPYIGQINKILLPLTGRYN